jgi:MFS family permease
VHRVSASPRPAGGAATLAALCAAQFVLQLDFSIVNVALPSIRRDLGLTAGTLQWLVTGYAMTFGSLLVLGGRLGDGRDRRRLLATGLTLFLVASVAAGLAQDTALLVGARVVQGAAAALVSPSALGLVMQVFPDGPARVRALSIWQAATAAGATTGVIAGGILTQTVGWRGVFLVNVPLIVILLAVLTARFPAGEVGHGDGLPVIPSLTTTAVVAAFIYTLSRGEQAGLGDPVTLMAAGVTVLLATAAVTAQRVSPNPLIPRGFFTDRGRRGALLTMLLLGGVVSGYVYFVSQYMQTVLRFPPIDAGLGLAPATLTVVTSSTFGSRAAIARLGTRATLLIGLTSVTAGQLWLTFLSATGSYWANVLPAILLTAAGMGLTFPSISVTAVAGTGPAERGAATSLLVTAQQLGAAAGLAVLATVAATALPAHAAASAAQTSDGYRLAFRVAVALVLLTIAIAAVIIPRARRLPAPKPEAVSVPAEPQHHPPATQP